EHGFEYEARVRRHDGSYRWHILYVRPFEVRQGTVTRWFGVCLDVDDLKVAKAEAEEANRTKDAFLAAGSHELRTPLQAILGWARMLESGTLDEERRRRALEVIERNACAQSQLVEDFLDVSRIERNALRIEREPLDLCGVVEAVVEGARPG